MKHRPHKRPSKPNIPSLPQGIVTTVITELLSDGRGFVRIDGKAVMIAGVLPDETVSFRYIKQTKQRFEGEVVDIIRASPARVSPPCQVFTRCGGCVLQHLNSAKQIIYKQQQLLDTVQKPLNKHVKIVAKPLTASHWGYRRRARVGLKWQTDSQRVEVGFRGRASSHLVPATNCEVLAPELSALFVPLSKMVSRLHAPDSITHVEMTLAETPEGGNQIALTFRHMIPLTDADNDQLTQFSESHNALIYLQGGDDNSVTGLNHDETLLYFLDTGETYSRLQMQFMPYHFTQVNFAINRKMVRQALDWLDLQPSDCVLDLFCGLGNFTLPIAQRTDKAVGVEGEKSLVEWAKYNAESNAIDNVEFHQADLTQNTQLMSWRVNYRYNKVLIDPPRAGAADIMPLLKTIKPERICYVSCHGATLARDVSVLVNDYGYRLDTIGAMDMFPQTAHLEAMVLLIKK